MTCKVSRSPIKAVVGNSNTYFVAEVTFDSMADLEAGLASDAAQAAVRELEIDKCPSSNLPEAKSGRWGQGLTQAKMAVCQWLSPVLVGRFEFLEWTGENHLRHSKFIGLSESENAKDVVRE